MITYLGDAYAHQGHMVNGMLEIIRNFPMIIGRNDNGLARMIVIARSKQQVLYWVY